MNGVSNSIASATSLVELKERFRPAIKPEVQRVRANPFYPGGLRPQSQQSAEVQREQFESNLPGRETDESKKVGTVLNTLA
jgi:CRISPR/Cas system-associated endonuclease/helicase Cas3